MSARHSSAFVLTVLCMVQTGSASDLVYQAGQADGTPATQSDNQLILVTHESEISATDSQTTAPISSRFFRQDQQPSTTPTAKAVPTDRTPLLQPTRVAAGKQEFVAPGGASFKDRLRQLSSGEPVKKQIPATQQTKIAAPPTVASSANYTAVEEAAVSPAIDNLVYLDDAPANAKQKPKVVLTQVYSGDLDRAFSAVPDPATFQATASNKDESPVPLPMPEADKIVFRPAVIDVSRNGQAVLRPNVLVAQSPPPIPDGAHLEELPAEPEAIVPEEWSTSIVDGTYTDYMATAEPRLGPMQALYGRVCARLQGPCGCEKGLGTERVMHAISFVDTTQPMNNFRMRFDAAYDYESPDRAEYFWAQIGGGRGPGDPNVPTPAPDVDYQDIRTYMEIGGDKFSVGTDVPIRLVDPNNLTFGNHSGLSDINITTKLVFLDGHRWQITNLFRTYIPSGDAGKGLGTGHASIEPGFAMRYKYSDYTYFHGDLKYWVPLGGDPDFEGEVLNYGIAMSHVWRETDCFAVMPTIELKGYSFLSGQETLSAFPPTTSVVDPEGILLVHPGIRWAWDHGTDCGLREIGLFGGFAATSQALYEEMLRLEFRWSW